jgi:hypothetical protein
LKIPISDLEIKVLSLVVYRFFYNFG